MQSHLKNELRLIISGTSQVRFGTIIQTIAGYLGDGTKSGPKAEETKQVREQEKKRLESFVSERNLWVNDIDFTQYVSEGAEQRVYLKDSENVLKLNDNDKKIVYLNDTFTVLKIESKRLEFSMISSGVEATSVYTPY